MMELALLIVLCIGCLLYAVMTHRTNDRLQHENLLLRDSLAKVADGKAQACRLNGMIYVKEIE